MPFKDKEVAKNYAKERMRHLRKNDPERANKYYIKNKEKILTRMKERHVELTYGLTPEEYTEKTIKQQNRCAICFKEETSKTKRGSIKPLSVDHCHTTGKIRCLLCSKCNSLLGMCNEQEEILYAAIEYLKKHK